MGDESYGLPVARGLDRPLQPLHHLVHRVAPPLRMSVLGVEPGKIRRYAEETIFQVVNLSHVNKALGRKQGTARRSKAPRGEERQQDEARHTKAPQGKARQSKGEARQSEGEARQSKAQQGTAR